MFNTEWEILLVDDEPDILSITKLAMRDFAVYGLPLKIHTTVSKAATVEFLNGRPDRIFSRLTVAFIDVVMENDSAGLELCQEIREQMQNYNTQLFIRTGQPGIAPERDVIDRYDINGYFTKAETTEDKLYSLVKSGMRQYVSTAWAQGAYWMLNSLVAEAGSRAKLADSYRRSQGRWDKLLMATTPESAERARIAHGLMVNRQIINTGLWANEILVADQIARLSQLDGLLLTPDGDKYVRDDRNNQLIQIAAQPATPAVNFYFSGAFEAPMPIILLLHNFFKSFGTLWQEAGE